jgi:hypothetical protein
MIWIASPSNDGFNVLRNGKPQSEVEMTERMWNELQESDNGAAHIQRLRAKNGAVGALAVGALALGAVAVGALAIGRLVVGMLRVGNAQIHSLEIKELKVKRLHVDELVITETLITPGENDPRR